jgi:hypothetical protein
MKGISQIHLTDTTLCLKITQSVKKLFADYHTLMTNTPHQWMTGAKS